jgi:hypothetical protein
MTLSPSHHDRSPVLLITTLAMYQTIFWASVGEALKQRGVRAAFLSFEDRSSELLRARGFEVFALAPEEAYPDTSDAAVDAARKRYRLPPLNLLLSHERVSFGIREEAELRRKLLAYLALADRAVASLQQRGHEVVMVQELGGFICVMASYHAARSRQVDNWFIEPAFFRGRLFFLKNQFAALSVAEPSHGPISPELASYLAKTLEARAIVVPHKDRHHYTSAVRKVANLRNVRRLAEKLVDKYVLGKHQEFGYIGRHVAVHARMLWNSARLKRHYTPLSALGRFIYYPLHVPGDVALTLRSPQYLDQLALIDFIARSVPIGYRLAVKEHPAMVGAIDARRLIELTRRYDNLAILPADTNNYDVLQRCAVVVSVNSKSGAEGLLLGKPVVVLGDAFYRTCPFATPLQGLSELPATLEAAIQQPAPKRAAIERYFEAVWRHSFPGELYAANPQNVEAFTDSMLAALELDEVRAASTA